MTTFAAILLFVVIAAAMLCVYFYPSARAYQNKHPDTTAIFVLNLLLGWLFIPWVIALVWAYKGIGPTKAATTGAVKNCPYCAEQILVQATRCKHCRSDL